MIVTGDGTRLFYNDWGAGRPVVLLAGRAQTSDTWHYHMLRLVRHGFRALAYDRRGHGRSDQPATGYDYDTLADDLASVIDQLDLHDVILVGHSMGGGEIVRYVSRHGAERVGGVILVSSTTPFMKQTADNPDGVPVEVADAVRAAIATDFPGWCADIADDYFAPETSRAMKEWSASLALQTSLLACIELDHTFSDADFRSELAALTVPAAVIHGGADIFVPADLCAHRTAALLPHASLHIYDDAPHGLPLTHIERLSSDVISFAQDPVAWTRDTQHTEV